MSAKPIISDIITAGDCARQFNLCVISNPALGRFSEQGLMLLDDNEKVLFGDLLQSFLSHATNKEAFITDTIERAESVIELADITAKALDKGLKADNWEDSLKDLMPPNLKQDQKVAQTMRALGKNAIADFFTP